MISIREFRYEDVEKARRIYDLFYKDQFAFPDFLNSFLCAFAINDSDDTPICYGGLRITLEATIVTNKDISVKSRRKALYEMLNANTFVAGKTGFDSFSAVTDDHTWERQLIKAGFHKRGNALSIEV